MRAPRKRSAPQVNPWSHRMALCIAAACQDRGKARIVISTDWRVGAAIATPDDEDKLYWINDNVPVLIAGTIHRGIELRDTITDYLDQYYRENPEPGSVTEYQVTNLIKRPVAMFKRQLAGEHTSLKFGLGYEEFSLCTIASNRSLGCESDYGRNLEYPTRLLANSSVLLGGKAQNLQD